MRLGVIIAFILLALIALSVPIWPYSVGWSYYPSALICIVLIIFLIYLLVRRRRGP